METLTSRKPSLWRRYLPIALSVTVGVVISFVLYYLVLQWEQQKIRTNFNKAAEDRAFAIQRALAHRMDLLKTVDYFLQANSDDLSRERFQQFTSRMLNQYPDLQAIDWVPRVTDARRAEFETQARQIFPGFQMTELTPEGGMVQAGQRPEYFPFYFLEPLQGNEQALGFDLGADSQQAVRQLLQVAADNGEMQAISHLTLLQESASLHGLLVFMPVYYKDMPTGTTSQRREALKGFILGVFQVGDILNEAMRYLDLRPINIRVYDESPDVISPTTGEGQFLYFYDSLQSDPEFLDQLSERELAEGEQLAKELHLKKPFLLAGRTWSVECTPAPGYHRTTGGGWQAITVLVLGLLVTAFLAIFYYNTMRHAYIMAEAAESANRAQSRFLANMSHELRTPLNAIVGYSELLQEEAVDLNDPTILQDVEKIYISGKYMLSLTDGILDLSKIKAGKIELHSETCKLSHVLEEVISIVTPLLKKNGNALKVDYPEEIGTMQTDVTRLHQILFNLLNNANESTEQGEIKLEVSRENIQNREWIRFAVSDSGGGMSIEQRDWLLRTLSRGADRDRSADEEEVGFALAISSHFWRMMGGELDIHSEPNRGSTFILRLPAHPDRG